MVGSSANACVETTLREAYMRDLDVVALTDCIVTVREDWYETTSRSGRIIYVSCPHELSTLEEALAWLRTVAPRGEAALEGNA